MFFLQEGQLKTVDENMQYANSTKTKIGAFQDVYPFTTEMISGYFDSLQLEGTNILTVGSSLDQALNALVYDVKHITVYDINANTADFYKLKKDLIMKNSRHQLYNAVCNNDQIPMISDVPTRKEVIRMNPYLQTDENYQKVQERLQENNITFVLGDIFKMDQVLTNEKFDRIIFSNILQYIDFFAKGQDSYSFLAEHFEQWDKHLNEEGIMQLLYLYSVRPENIRKPNHSLAIYNLKKVAETLSGVPLDIEFIPGCEYNGTDAVVTYTKKKR